MNTAELETLIRTILSEKLAPAPAPQEQQGIFRDVGSAIDAAHQAFLRYQQCPLKTRSAIISALRETLAPSWRRWRKRAPRKPAWATKKINI
jgi:propionaldehyde dehydrogenase